MIESVDRESPRTGTCAKCKRNDFGYSVFEVTMVSGEKPDWCDPCIKAVRLMERRSSVLRRLA